MGNGNYLVLLVMHLFLLSICLSIILRCVILCCTDLDFSLFVLLNLTFISQSLHFQIAYDYLAKIFAIILGYQEVLYSKRKKEKKNEFLKKLFHFRCRLSLQLERVFVSLQNFFNAFKSSLIILYIFFLLEIFSGIL